MSKGAPASRDRRLAALSHGRWTVINGERARNEKHGAEDARKWRRELARLGVVVCVENRRQYWRITPRQRRGFISPASPSAFATVGRPERARDVCCVSTFVAGPQRTEG